jgi:inhibitor of KinA
VSAGSVGIAGNQTGIYPMDSPGGWNIIGRTPVKLFDVHAKQPVLFQPGDEVTFYPITQEAFDAFDARSFNPISA